MLPFHCWGILPAAKSDVAGSLLVKLSWSRRFHVRSPKHRVGQTLNMECLSVSCWFCWILFMFFIHIHMIDDSFHTIQSQASTGKAGAPAEGISTAPLGCWFCSISNNNGIQWGPQQPADDWESSILALFWNAGVEQANIYSTFLGPRGTKGVVIYIYIFICLCIISSHIWPYGSHWVIDGYKSNYFKRISWETMEYHGCKLP